jgi:dipeptidyl aminopeptidase/acylaminoacyl peptidase
VSGGRNPRSGAGPRDPKRGGGPLGSIPLAATLSILGLLVIGVVTYALATGDLPIGGTAGNPGSSENPAVLRTPTPPDVVVVPTAPPPEQADPIPGTFVYVKDGNVWLQTNGAAKQLTKGRKDSMPTFSPDGKTVYFVREREADGRWSIGGVVRDYLLSVPALMSIPVDGGKATRVLDGLIDPPGSFRWNAFIRNPDVSPSGRYIAIASELPDPTRSDVTLKIWDTRRKRLIDPGLSEVAPLGHQDPEWRPDGDKLIYVRNDRDGAKGTPRLYSYDPATEKSRPITGPGYLQPSFSPDGKYIAATKTSAFGTDVVILSATNGAELVRLTDDGASWAPVWSPNGDQIAYLHVAGQLVDLRLAQLEGTGPTWTAKDPIDLTSNAGLDGASQPDWFVPEDQRVAPVTPAPSVAASPSTAP